MKDIISGFELNILVKELNELVGSRLDKIYHRRDELVLQFYNSKLKKAFLFFKLPSIIFLTNDKPDTSESAGGFCMFLRRRIGISRVVSIEQIDFERILKIGFEGREGKYDLYIELFSPGNFVLCDENNKILSIQNTLNTKDRVIRGGVDYVPLGRDYNFLTMGEDDFSKLFASTEKGSIVKTMALELGLGGTFSEEVCTLAKVDKDSPKPTVDEIKKIVKASKLLMKRKIEPIIVNGDVLPFKLKSTKDFEVCDDLFSFCIGKNLIDKFKGKKEEVEKADKGKAVDKVNSVIDKQEGKLVNLEKEAVEYQRIGELIYEKYQQVDELLKVINEAKKTKSYDEIRKVLVEKKLIKSLDSKEQSIILDL